jgi:phage baseplate assembly protein gpV
VLSGQGERAGASEHALGIVTAVSDPERLGRVRVSLPGHGDVETEWMHVVSAGAGRNKGMVVLPDVGDRVLVLLPHGEPGAGVVMGGLYGMEGPADSGVEGGRTRRYTLQTPGGQRVVLDDGRQAIQLEDSSGNVVELTPEVVRIHAATDLELEAPGRKVVIRGDQIDFQRG